MSNLPSWVSWLAMLCHFAMAGRYCVLSRRLKREQAEAQAKTAQRWVELQSQANAVGEHYRVEAEAVIGAYCARLREVADDIGNPRWHGVDIFADLRQRKRSH